MSLKMSTSSIYLWSAEKTINSQSASETTVWADPESRLPMFGVIVYIFVIPILCGTGFVTNLMNIIVFARPKLLSAACSSYYYFISISFCDMISCVLLLFSCISRTVYNNEIGWMLYDTMVFIPVSCIVRTVSNFLTVSMSLDRVLYIKSSTPRKPPSMCQPKVARWVLYVSCFVSVLLNLPFFFIFQYNDGNITTTDFFYTQFYGIHSAIKFGILLLCALILFINNFILIQAVRQWVKSRQCQKQLIICGIVRKKKPINQAHLTVTSTVFVFMFLVGEVPLFLSSHRTFPYALFEGTITPKSLETFQIIATLLNALHISLNILIYASCNPPYMAELFIVLEILCLRLKKESVKDEATVEDNYCKHSTPDRNKALVPYEPKTAAATNCSQSVQICLVHGAVQMCVTTTTKFNSYKGGRTIAGEYKVCNCLPLDLKELSTTADNDCKGDKY